MAALTRPETCHVCVLHRHAEGFALPDGPTDSWLLLVGEALGKVEALTGRPFMGDAGGMLQRLLNMLGWKRDEIRIHNVISCRPPNDWFDERAPWYRSALAYCPYLENTLREQHPVVVPMGGTALRRVMGLEQARKIRVQDFHGSILRDPLDRFWVVPTFHPSFLQRGAHNLIGTVIWDLLQAREAFEHGKPKDTASIIVDPPIEWFKQWVDMVVAARRQDPHAYPISSDVETPDKSGGRDEGEITNEDRSYQIQRVNVACHTDEGVTVPYIGPYIDELKRLHQSPGPIWAWNKEYDFPRLLASAVFTSEADQRRVVDLMWLAHYLQSDIPRGLGFWAPFYSTYGPWKHLAESEPGLYGGVDGLQTHRIGFGVISDLIKSGMYRGAMRHVHQLHWAALRPAQLVGVKIDRQRLMVFKQELSEKASQRLDALQHGYPQELMPMTPKEGLVKPPLDNVLHVKATAFTRKGQKKAGKEASELKLDLYKRARVVERLVLKQILVCKACGDQDVPRRHRCKVGYLKKDGTTGWKSSENPPDISIEVASVTRWFWQEPFNPDSWQQVLSYIKYKQKTDKKYTPGRAKKTHKESTDRETLARLEVKTKDRFFTHLLQYRAIVKVKGTYVEGTERRLDKDDRVHPTPTFKPSMMRLSYVDPNITNVVADKGGKKGLAAGFRKCVVASPGCRLLEVDFASIEAVKVGDRARDPDYIRLARLGVHAGMCTYVQGRPFERSWLKERPQDLKLLFDEIKYSQDEKIQLMYDRTKRFVHGKAYGLTVFGMVLQFPELFPTIDVAQRYARIFADMAPQVERWQNATQQRAATVHYLGGPTGEYYGLQSEDEKPFHSSHPYGYKHWFWSVFNYRRLSTVQYYRLIQQCEKAKVEPPIAVINDQYFRVGLSEDAKRSLADFPQSIAAGDLKEVGLALFDPDSPSFIGDAYYGQTPLRAPIHDSFLFEIPDRVWDSTVETICKEMQRPMGTQPLPAEWELGEYLTNSISVKVGHDWDAMEKIRVPGFSDLEPSYWTPADKIEEEGDDDDLDLRRSA